MIDSYSMQKYIRKQLQAISINQRQNQILGTFWRRHQGISESPLLSIVSASKMLLKILDIAFVEGQSQASVAIYSCIRDLLQQTRNEDIFEIQVIKIKFFLLSLSHPELQCKTSLSLKKVGLFLEAVEMNPFYALLQEDYYSQLQLLYFEAAKLSLKEGYSMEALKYAKMSLGCVKRQLAALLEPRQSSNEEKLRRIIEKKGKTLQLVFYLQHGIRLISSQMASEQIVSTIFPTYQSLFDKIQMDFYPQQTIAKARALAKTDQQLLKQTAKFKQRSLIKEQNSDKSIHLVPQCQRRMSTQEEICLQLAQSLKFVEHLHTSIKSSAGAHSQESRTSLQISSSDHPVNGNMKANTKKQSRFSYAPSSKQSKSRSQVDQKKTSIKISEGNKPQIRQGKRVINRQLRFSMVIRAEQRSRERLKSLNPLRQSKSGAINRVSTTEMFKNGIMAFGPLK